MNKVCELGAAIGGVLMKKTKINPAPVSFSAFLIFLVVIIIAAVAGMFVYLSDISYADETGTGPLNKALLLPDSYLDENTVTNADSEILPVVRSAQIVFTEKDAALRILESAQETGVSYRYFISSFTEIWEDNEVRPIFFDVILSDNEVYILVDYLNPEKRIGRESFALFKAEDINADNIARTEFSEADEYSYMKKVRLSEFKLIFTPSAETIIVLSVVILITVGCVCFLIKLKTKVK